MPDEKWIKSEILPELYGPYKIKSVVCDPRGLVVLLNGAREERSLVQLTFYAHIFSYRRSLLSVRKNTEGFPLSYIMKNTLFRVENSSYVQKINQESCNIFDGSKLQHFSIVDQNVLVEVITTQAPIYKLLQHAE